MLYYHRDDETAKNAEPEVFPIITTSISGFLCQFILNSQLCICLPLQFVGLFLKLRSHLLFHGISNPIKRVAKANTICRVI